VREENWAEFKFQQETQQEEITQFMHLELLHKGTV